MSIIAGIFLGLAVTFGLYSVADIDGVNDTARYALAITSGICAQAAYTFHRHKD